MTCSRLAAPACEPTTSARCSHPRFCISRAPCSTRCSRCLPRSGTSPIHIACTAAHAASCREPSAPRRPSSMLSDPQPSPPQQESNTHPAIASMLRDFQGLHMRQESAQSQQAALMHMLQQTMQQSMQQNNQPAAKPQPVALTPDDEWRRDYLVGSTVT